DQELLKEKESTEKQFKKVMEREKNKKEKEINIIICIYQYIFRFTQNLKYYFLTVSILHLPNSCINNLTYNVKNILKKVDATNKLVVFNNYFALPCAATASIAFFTVSSSPKNFIETTGLKFSSNSYSNGIPVGKLRDMIWSSEIPPLKVHLYNEGHLRFDHSMHGLYPWKVEDEIITCSSPYLAAVSDLFNPILEYLLGQVLSILRPECFVLSSIQMCGLGQICNCLVSMLYQPSYHPQNKFFWFHSLSPCLTITTLYLAIVFRMKIGNLEILKSSNELLKVNIKISYNLVITD
ncbi:hypothetical protein AGLY_013678, partial [Aphis glycines]